jgi:hypothetical protein
MVIRSGSESIEITLREMGPEGTPAEGDLGVTVTVSGPAFAGRNDTVWIGRDEWAGFLEDLRELDRTRRGEALVRAMSPEEFQLAVFAADRAGHLAAEGWVGREYMARNGVVRDRVTASLEIDPSDLPALVRQFAALAFAG